MIRAEQVLVDTYEQLIAGSLLPGGAVSMALEFLAQERQHVDQLTTQCRRLGGRPPRKARRLGRFGALNGSQAVTFLLGVERTALSVYYTELARVRDPALARVAAAIMANEAQHASLLREVLSPGDTMRAVPSAFVFGDAPGGAPSPSG
jgi:rubrerythrin